MFLCQRLPPGGSWRRRRLREHAQQNLLRFDMASICCICGRLLPPQAVPPPLGGRLFYPTHLRVAGNNCMAGRRFLWHQHCLHGHLCKKARCQALRDAPALRAGDLFCADGASVPLRSHRRHADRPLRFHAEFPADPRCIRSRHSHECRLLDAQNLCDEVRQPQRCGSHYAVLRRGYGCRCSHSRNGYGFLDAHCRRDPRPRRCADVLLWRPCRKQKRELNANNSYKTTPFRARNGVVFCMK